MDWKEIYRSRLMDADTAMQAVKSGDKVIVHGGCAQPVLVLDAFAKRIRDLESVTVSQLLPIDPKMPYLAEDVRDKVRLVTSYLGAAFRDWINNGTGEYTPVHLKDWSEMYGAQYQPDVALVHVSPPNKHGYINLGVTVLCMLSALQNCKTIIAEVNENMPRVHGDGNIHVSEISHFVESNAAIRKLPRGKASAIEEAIGGYCAELIHDGDCLQMGIGSIPDAVCSFLKNRHGLGVHSEVYSDGIMELFLEGAIDNKNKTLHPGRMIATFLMGTPEFYDFIDDNPSVYLVPVEQSNDPYIIGRNKNLVSVNSSVSVDLMGQAASESIGTKQFSGTGGQVDFIRGAALSPGGRSILAFPSTAGKPGNLQSRIVPQLSMGTPVTTARTDVEYVVTEYGIARLKWKSLRERAHELISVAHPDFRPELTDALKKMNW